MQAGLSVYGYTIPISILKTACADSNRKKRRARELESGLSGEEWKREGEKERGKEKKREIHYGTEEWEHKWKIALRERFDYTEYRYMYNFLTKQAINTWRPDNRLLSS